MNRTFAIIQARMGSTRFPGKSMAEIAGLPILRYLFRQLSFAKRLDGVILATTTNIEDDVLATYAESQDWSVFRGDSEDVLGRYFAAARTVNPAPQTGIVRLTGDDILTDPLLIDAVVEVYMATRGLADYVEMDRAGNIPYGAGVEMFSFAALNQAHEQATDPGDREHVSSYIQDRPDVFRHIEIVSHRPITVPPLSIDTPDDLAWNRDLIAEMNRFTKPPYHLHDIVEAYRRLGVAGGLT